MLLAMAIPRRDVKPLAKALLARFGSFAAVISAVPEKLETVTGMGETSVAALKLVRAASVRLLQQEALGRDAISSWDRLLDYCRAAMAHEPVEQLRLLFLDRKNVLIADEVQQRGTVDHTPVYPREVVKRALDLAATALVDLVPPGLGNRAKRGLVAALPGDAVASRYQCAGELLRMRDQPGQGRAGEDRHHAARPRGDRPHRPYKLPGKGTAIISAPLSRPVSLPLPVDFSFRARHREQTEYSAHHFRPASRRLLRIRGARYPNAPSRSHVPLWHALFGLHYASRLLPACPRFHAHGTASLYAWCSR